MILIININILPRLLNFITPNQTPLPLRLLDTGTVVPSNDSAGRQAHATSPRVDGRSRPAPPPAPHVTPAKFHGLTRRVSHQWALALLCLLTSPRSGAGRGPAGTATARRTKKKKTRTSGATSLVPLLLLLSLHISLSPPDKRGPSASPPSPPLQLQLPSILGQKSAASSAPIRSDPTAPHAVEAERGSRRGEERRGAAAATVPPPEERGEKEEEPYPSACSASAGPIDPMDSEHWISRLAAAKRFYAAQLGHSGAATALPPFPCSVPLGLP